MNLKFDDYSGQIGVYEFQDFEDKVIKEDIEVEDYEIKEFAEMKQKIHEKMQTVIKKERLLNEGTQFTISPIIQHFRGLEEQEEREKDEAIEQEVVKRSEEVKQQAYDSGFQKGQENGYQDAYNKMMEEANAKVELLQSYIESIHAERADLLKNEKLKIYETVKTLTKWVILRELKDDGAYLERLLEKLILETQSKTNLLLKVDREYLEAMPEIIERTQDKVGRLTNVRVESVHRTDEEREEGMILESDNGIIDGTLKEQFDSIDKLFDTLDVYES